MNREYLFSLLTSDQVNRKPHARILLMLVSAEKKGHHSSTIEEIQQMLREEIKKEYSVDQLLEYCGWLDEHKAIIQYGTKIYSPRTLGIETAKLLKERAEQNPNLYMKFVRGSYSQNISPSG